MTKRLPIYLSLEEAASIYATVLVTELQYPGAVHAEAFESLGDLVDELADSE